MAALPKTLLETHPTGTGGINEILNGNWERLEELLDDALSSGDAGYNAIARALLREDLSGIAAGATIVFNGSKFTRRAAWAALTYAASVALDFAVNLPTRRGLALTGDVTITTANLAAGGALELVIAADASTRAFTWPAGWKWIGATAPASIAAGKTGVLSLTSTTTADTGMVARWTVEP